MLEDPALDIIHLVTHAHEHVVELLEPIAVEMVEAARRVVCLRAREDLEHDVPAAVRLQELRNGGLVYGALGEKAIATQVKEVCTARADGIGNLWKQLAIRQHHAGAAARCDGDNFAGAHRSVDGLEGRWGHALLGVEERSVHVKGNEVVRHGFPSTR